MEGGFTELLGLVDEHVRDPEILCQPRVDGDVLEVVVIVVVVVGVVGSVRPVLDPDPFVGPHHPDRHLDSDDLLHLQNLMI